MPPRSRAKGGKLKSDPPPKEEVSSPDDSDYWIGAHDVFNLIALVPINSLNLFYLKKWYYSEEGALDVFWIFFAATVAYFVVDLLWLLLKPQSVKSPNFIMGHHVVTMTYLLLPYNHPQMAWCMGACMSVEINTWFIIARRRWNHPLICSIFFYITWFGIRLILYPYLLLKFYQEYMDFSEKIGTYYNIIAVAPIFQLVLLYLNMKWTFDLYHSKTKGIIQRGL